MARRRLLAIAAALSGLVVLLAAGVFAWGYRAAVGPGPLTSETTVIVPRGAGVKEIARQLAAKGVIEHPYLFSALVRLHDAHRQLKAGEYSFDAGTSMLRAMTILREGRTVVRRVTVAEGLTSKDIVTLLEKTEGLEGEITALPPEGSLLPDTYHFSYGDNVADITERMSKAMRETVDRLWAGRAADLPLRSPEDAVILASIVEKETAVPAERPRIVAVFVNRLRKGMRIEADPTVLYGLIERAGPLGRPLTRADLQIDTPYNTYRIDGLPPGPICNPGEASLAAVMNPIDTDELFFVADGTGGHAFARTLEEHNRNVARWRKLQRERAADPNAR